MRCKSIISWLDNAMAFSFYALIYFLPISIALLEIFTALALIFYLLKRGVIFYDNIKEGLVEWDSLNFLKKSTAFLNAFRPLDTYLNRPITIFLFVCLFSVFASRYPHVSFMGFLLLNPCLDLPSA